LWTRLNDFARARFGPQAVVWRPWSKQFVVFL